MVHAHIDTPAAGSTVYLHGFDVDGWFRSEVAPFTEIQIHLHGLLIGRTRIRHTRADVARQYNNEAFGDSGFVVRCEIPESLRMAGLTILDCYAAIPDEGLIHFARHPVALSGIDYRLYGYGEHLTDDTPRVLHRHDVYGSGPPAEHAHPPLVELITRYVPPGTHILDVGCGVGAWAAALTPLGVHWQGCEARTDFVERMKAKGLPVVAVSGALPFADKSFDGTLCIEVLEHVSDYREFLTEVARVSRVGGIFSVPNFGSLPITDGRFVLPWHMLEGDHKNFFTARSLTMLLEEFYDEAEVFEYGPIEGLLSVEGLPIYNHLFAVARHRA